MTWMGSPVGTLPFRSVEKDSFRHGDKSTGAVADQDLDQVPLFVKEGTILPLAAPVPFITPQTVFDITCKVYGDGPATAGLFEDDSFGFGYEQGRSNKVMLHWDGKDGSITRSGSYAGRLYRIVKWEAIGQ